MLEGCVAWPEEFARRYRQSGCWGALSLFEAVAAIASEKPDKIALVDGVWRRSYRDLLRNAETLAARFHALGLRPLDRIVFQLGNGVEFVEAFLALARIGVIPVMALPAHRKTEIEHFVRGSGAVALIVPHEAKGFDYREMAQSVAARCPDLRLVIVAGEPAAGQIGLRGPASAAGETVMLPLTKIPCPLSEEVALMLLSGGTTGLPKLIPRSHADYLYGVRQSARAAGMNDDTVFLAVLPMAHNYTLGAPGVLGTLLAGGVVVFSPATAADEILPLIARERVTVVSAAGPLVSKWLGSGLIDQFDLRSLKVFMSGGARLAPELRRRVEQEFRCVYQESFGTAEGLLCMTLLSDSDTLRLNSSGRPVSEFDEIRIVGPSDEDLPDGVPGELLVRGPYTIRGYYKAPQINGSAFTADGFYRTGDVVIRSEGYLSVQGRIKDLINRGGEKISCEEIESHLLAHPAIETACVVAIPDEVFTEKACAVVVLRGAQTLTLEQVAAFLKDRGIARFKIPERLEVVKDMPISPAGKILRRELRAAFGDQRLNSAIDGMLGVWPY